MKEMAPLKVVYRKTGDLIPYVNNARTHSEQQVTQIASSIKEFGFNNPILTDGDNGVVAGHGRLLAAQKLGLQEVPTIELSHLSGPQKKAYILADNKIALNSGWDSAVLSLELKSIQEDVPAGLWGYTGFSDEELEGLLSDAGGADFPDLPDEDALPSRSITLNFKSEDDFNRFNEYLKRAGAESGLKNNADICLYIAGQYHNERC